MTFPKKESHEKPPQANKDYWISGTLKQKENGSYLLKVSSKTQWNPVPGTSTRAEKRFLWKKRVSEWIESQYSHPVSAAFLAGLITGEFDDYWMLHQFSRFGLQHLLAISGFHFAIIATFLSLILRFLFHGSMRTIILLLSLGGYCFFLGPQPSILRAWIMCSLTLIGGLLEKQTTALNSLGLTLLLILAYDPLLSLQVGFQFSFLITAAILLYYPIAIDFCHSLLPKRTLSEVLEMNPLNQYGYCILAFFRQGLALTLAVNLFAFPLTLYYFQQFSWMSLFYNLFFPFLASASLCLLLIGGLFSIIPFVGSTIHALNDHYTFFLLQLTYQIPPEIDYYLRTASFHSFWVVLYVCLLLMWGIVWREKVEASLFEERAFGFI